MQPQLYTARIMYNRHIGRDRLWMRLECTEALREAQPGQFIMLQVSEHADPLLRRPFSLCRIEDHAIEIVYAIAGRGTAIMAEWENGRMVNFIGPLGRGFAVSQALETAYLVAGGMGIAPLLSLMQRLEQNKNKITIRIFMGGKTAEDVAVLEDFTPLKTDIFIATENGDRGFHGLVTELFEDYLKNNALLNTRRIQVFGCGPLPMAQALGGISATYKLNCQVSLEARMACGIGVCLGCAVKTKIVSTNTVIQNIESFQYQRVCADGPIFTSTELIWDT